MCVALLESHANLSVIASIDQAIPIDNCLIDYSTKMPSGEFSHAVSTMLAAMNYCEENKSKALDQDSEIRKCKFFAMRTINSFQGKIQHDLKTMIAALMGLKSELSSENFHYVFPHDLVDYLDTEVCSNSISDEVSIGSNSSSSIEENTRLDCEISNLEKILEDNDLQPTGYRSSKGARMFKIDNDTLVFLTQVESYTNRGDNFLHF